MTMPTVMTMPTMPTMTTMTFALVAAVAAWVVAGALFGDDDANANAGDDAVEGFDGFGSVFSSNDLAGSASPVADSGGREPCFSCIREFRGLDADESAVVPHRNPVGRVPVR